VAVTGVETRDVVDRFLIKTFRIVVELGGEYMGE
jgi:hypothetical protein